MLTVLYPKITKFFLSYVKVFLERSAFWSGICILVSLVIEAFHHWKIQGFHFLLPIILFCYSGGCGRISCMARQRPFMCLCSKEGEWCSSIIWFNSIPGNMFVEVILSLYFLLAEYWECHKTQWNSLNFSLQYHRSPVVCSTSLYF